MKNVNGVESVDVSLNKGLATMTLKPGNTVTMKQLRDAIGKNGFTTKQSRVTVDGTVSLDGNNARLKVTGSGEIYQLKFSDAKEIEAHNGRVVTVEGTIPEASKGKPADTIIVSSVTERTGR